MNPSRRSLLGLAAAFLLGLSGAHAEDKFITVASTTSLEWKTSEGSDRRRIFSSGAGPS